MKKENKKVVATFKEGKNNALMVSERKSGESELNHKYRIERRIDVMKKIVESSNKKKIETLLEEPNKSDKKKIETLLEEPNKSDKKKIKELLEEVITAITKWKYECIAQGEGPVFISSFISLEPGKELSSHTRNVMFGEEAMLMSVLKRTNKMLDPKGGKYSLFKKSSSKKING